MFQIMFTHYDYSVTQYHSFITIVSKSGNAARVVPAFNATESFVSSLATGILLYNLI